MQYAAASSPRIITSTCSSFNDSSQKWSPFPSLPFLFNLALCGPPNQYYSTLLYSIRFCFTLFCYILLYYIECGMVWYDMLWCGTVKLDLIWFDLIWFDLCQFDTSLSHWLCDICVAGTTRPSGMTLWSGPWSTCSKSHLKVRNEGAAENRAWEERRGGEGRGGGCAVSHRNKTHVMSCHVLCNRCESETAAIDVSYIQSSVLSRCRADIINIDGSPLSLSVSLSLYSSCAIRHSATLDPCTVSGHLLPPSLLYSTHHFFSLGFEDVIEQHFKLRRDSISAQIDTWATEKTSAVFTNPLIDLKKTLLALIY